MAKQIETRTVPDREALPQEAMDEKSINVISSSAIRKKVSQVLCHLNSSPLSGEGENGPLATPKLVKLEAKSKVASKLITIAEIVKRSFGESQAQLPLQSTSAAPAAARERENAGVKGAPRAKKKASEKRVLYQYTALSSTTSSAPLQTTHSKLKAKPSARKQSRQQQQQQSAVTAGETTKSRKRKRSGTDQVDLDDQQQQQHGRGENARAMDKAIENDNDNNGTDADADVDTDIGAAGQVERGSDAANESDAEHAQDEADVDDDDDNDDDGDDDENDDTEEFFTTLTAGRKDHLSSRQPLAAAAAAAAAAASSISPARSRQTPVLTIYLCTASIPEFKRRYGEQCVSA